MARGYPPLPGDYIMLEDVAKILTDLGYSPGGGGFPLKNSAGSIVLGLDGNDNPFLQFLNALQQPVGRLGATVDGLIQLNTHPVKITGFDFDAGQSQNDTSTLFDVLQPTDEDDKGYRFLRLFPNAANGETVLFTCGGTPDFQAIVDFLYGADLVDGVIFDSSTPWSLSNYTFNGPTTPVMQAYIPGDSVQLGSMTNHPFGIYTNNGNPQLMCNVDGSTTLSPPTADPHVAGKLWNNAGTPAISAGP